MIKHVVGVVTATWESGWIGKAQMIGIGTCTALSLLIVTIIVLRVIDDRFAKRYACKGVIRRKRVMAAVPNDENYVVVEDTPEVRRHPFVRYVFRIDCGEGMRDDLVFEHTVEPELYDHLSEGTIVPVTYTVGPLSKRPWLAEAPETVWQWERAIDDDMCDEPSASRPDHA